MSGPGSDNLDRHQMPDEPPPFLGRWRNVYIFVLTYLVCIISLCYLFTRVFA